ncbi:MAG: hypothetical protein AAGG01_24335, partial [Planctomycetota bacterium]
MRSQGLAYLKNSMLWDPITLLTVAVASGLAMARPSGARRAESVVAAALLLHLAYVVNVGGDFMSGRFLTGSFAVAVALLVRRRIDGR